MDVDTNVDVDNNNNNNTAPLFVIPTHLPEILPDGVVEADFNFMSEAFKEAKDALDAGEVPVGCVIVRNGQVVGRGQNMPNRMKDATTHAEFIAIDAVVANEGDSYVFNDCDLYVTVEPCVMCASALLILGFRRVFFGCSNQRFGGCGSVMALCDETECGLAYQGYECIPGLYSDEAIALLKIFYETPNPNSTGALQQSTPAHKPCHENKNKQQQQHQTNTTTVPR